MSGKPIIAFTMGDPSGIGPEVCIKSACAKKVFSVCTPVIYGDSKVLKKAANLCGKRIKVIKNLTSLKKNDGSIKVFQVASVSEQLVIGSLASDSGRVAMECVSSAVEDALSGKVSAIVTAPINKEAIKMSGYNFPGHTEYLAEKTGAKHFAMMLIGGKLKIALVTIHMSLEKALKSINKKVVYEKILILNEGLKSLGVSKPRIAVSALNPHAGEGGRFGKEEEEIIEPAIEQAFKTGVNCRGPYSPDTVFYFARKGEYDAVLAMYHDQGLIPVKLLAFDKGVNITLGLPIIRTSPDHGTAFDNAWQNKASSSSMEAAAVLAAKLAKRKSKKSFPPSCKERKRNLNHR
ncbi:MAG: 4-hydroxythreonine-4-phosphate dehydrogenase PdxA [Candidatus Aureabacteria bacterium]|nr:4-hydroxythreonine-4-phosphate dehydrogenase PdxA [Candidatus Auribacterota bacterium]